MFALFKISLFIGAVVNLYYLNKNADRYERRIKDGKLHLRQLFLGVALTLLLWPIAIYNNEVRNKKKEDE